MLDTKKKNRYTYDIVLINSQIQLPIPIPCCFSYFAPVAADIRKSVAVGTHIPPSTAEVGGCIHMPVETSAVDDCIQFRTRVETAAVDDCIQFHTRVQTAEVDDCIPFHTPVETEAARTRCVTEPAHTSYTM